VNAITIEPVKTATDEVRELIGELDRALDSEYPPEQNHGLSVEALFDPHMRFFIARLNGAAAGCAGVALFTDFAEVKRLYVRPRARGRGIGEALLARAELEAGNNALDVLRLETGDRQLAAIRLYERAGYRVCGAFVQYASMPLDEIATSIFYEKTSHNVKS
jgi:putative acetyltransferase